MTATSFGRELLDHVLAGAAAPEVLTHAVDLPGREARHASWPQWAHLDVVAALQSTGIPRPWLHQAAVAEHAYAGRHVVVSTGTASGKSLGYHLPVLSALYTDPRATALYLSPTKALGADQLRAVSALCREIESTGTGAVPAASPASHDSPVASVNPASYDGDTPREVREWVRVHSRWVFTNPDMLHLGLLGGHAKWSRFFRRLRFVVIDECHSYRGVFGSNVALIVRRLRRLCARFGAAPVFVLASATTSQSGAAASRLVGADVVEVTDDASPRGPRTVALWEPPLLPEVTGENGAPVRRSAGAEAARIMADLVVEGARTLTFVRSRRGAEITALTAAGLAGEAVPELADSIAAYRAGYLADDRRALEAALADGALLGVATTNALELGVDIAGLDAVVVAGYPGTVASFWQQAGRAGRRGQGSLVVLVARGDPLDTYLVHHPRALLERPVEATVTDPANPYVLGPQLLCAAVESPLTAAEVAELGADGVVAALVDDGLLRRRRDGWYPTADVRPHGEVDIRGSGGREVAIVDAETGRLLGTVDSGRAPATIHPGAVHIHQGESFVVDELDLDDGVALVHAEEPDWTTHAREDTSIEITEVHARESFGAVTVASVSVEVTHQVVGFLRTLRSGEVLDQVDLDMPPGVLPTRAVMYTVTPELLTDAGLADADFPGALHAAEHAAIGLLPLVATCDRWDIGGVSTALHADTGLPTVFVYDGHPGGAGFADRGHAELTRWLRATHDAVAACECASGCPSCIQSPKCGNGNEPLSKAGAVALLRAVLSELGRGQR
ncbi:DEAD/DEAH box helicase [Tomitella cavernea]|uniref:DEAD/DEAH box helicase n=1 Tax=Tomitella cavernea TaxID=1387982 RepID=A0ABP9CCD6_9ACTN|nr:DEAD/DEAH box helicase [Tomitella cavernea]